MWFRKPSQAKEPSPTVPTQEQLRLKAISLKTKAQFLDSLSDLLTEEEKIALSFDAREAFYQDVSEYMKHG